VSLDRRQEWERTGNGRISIESVGSWGDDVRAGNGLELGLVLRKGAVSQNQWILSELTIDRLHRAFYKAAILTAIVLAIAIVHEMERNPHTEWEGKLSEWGQDHLSELFASWHSTTDAAALAERDAFFAQVSALDAGYPGGLGSYLQRARDLLAVSASGANPFEGWRAEASRA
jgi:hypothetical protein